MSTEEEQKEKGGENDEGETQKDDEEYIDIIVKGQRIRHQVIRLQSDGNSFYRCLSWFMHEKESRYHRRERRNVVNQISDNWNVYSHLTRDENGKPFIDSKTYKSHMLREGVEGGMSEVEGAADHYMRKVEVYKGAQLSMESSKESPYGIFRMLLEESKTHYDVLVPVQTGTAKPTPANKPEYGSEEPANKAESGSEEPDHSSDDDETQKSATNPAPPPQKEGGDDEEEKPTPSPEKRKREHSSEESGDDDEEVKPTPSPEKKKKELSSEESSDENEEACG